MIGAIIGDIAGSRFEFHNHRSREFDLFTERCFATDDSVMTLAVAQALLETDRGRTGDLSVALVRSMQTVGRRYPDAGYGGRFYNWVFSPDPRPYNSWGNGSAMRVSACAWAAESLEEALSLARASAEVTHNHPEGIKGAEATAAAIFLAREGKGMAEIRGYIEARYYQWDFTVDELRPTYRFDESCMGTVPQALEAFFESVSFEDAVRTAVSLGGDSDTLAAITGSVAEAYYGVPAELRQKALTYLGPDLREILERFEEQFTGK